MVARRPIIRLQRLAQQRKDVEKNLVSNYGTFVGWLRSYPVGAQFIGTPPIMSFNKLYGYFERNNIPLKKLNLIIGLGSASTGHWPIKNFSNRRGESRPLGRVRPRRSVGTRGGCGDGMGPCACPREWRVRQGFLLTRWSLSPGGGQAQGPLIHPTPPLVPTGWLTSLAAFGRQHS